MQKPPAVLCIALVWTALALAQSRRASMATLYEGALVIVGDRSAPIDDAAFVVQDGTITAVGRKGELAPPSGATRVDLTGKTVMPAMIDVHVHIGYEGYTTWRAENHTPANVVDHLQREAYYGVGAAQSVGTSSEEQMIAIEKDQHAGKLPPAARLFFMPGMAPPNGGPDAVLRVATNQLHVVNEVTTADEARAAVRRMAGRKLRQVKMWVDDRGGTYPKMSPEVYTAIVDEAHKHHMIVNAHATTLPDQKAVLRAGADVLVHMVQREKIDDELMAIVREKKPYWATVIGLGDRSGACDEAFFQEQLPQSVVTTIQKSTEPKPLAPYCGPETPNRARREEILAYNFARMISSGARIVLGTDTGIEPGHTFGTGAHHEVARWVQLGLPPADAIVAATSRPAELLGIADMGTIAAGKSADFVVLDANPLEDIKNTRRISSVYLRGKILDRAALLAKWKRANTSK